ncbi:MAG: response regulator [Betaproteobacteria bacterium]|nr:response regulator [Betaproteobacteria bacterium]
MSQHEQLLKALDEPVFEMDAGGVVVYATASMSAWTGKESGYPLAGALAESDRPRFQQTLKRILDGKTGTALLELGLVTEAGTMPVEMKLAAGQRDGGKVLTIAGWMRDVSMEKAKEAAANVQGTHLLDLVENISDACVVENAEGGVEMVNTAFCELFHVEAAAQSLVGIPCTELFEQASSLTEKKVAPIYFPLDSENRDEFEFKFADGKRAKQMSLPVPGEAGIAGRLHIFHTLEVNAPAQTGSATITAQSQMVEKIARSLATTLESAGIAIHRAEQLELPGTVLDHFRRVESSAQAAFAEIAGLLDFSQMESGDLKIESMEFHLRDRIASMLDHLVPLAEEKSVHLRLSIEQDVPENLTGDGARLMLVLRSLLEAGLPTAQGGGDLALIVEPEYSAENQIHLSFRVESTPAKGNSRQKVVSATGQMQLSLARQIVRAMSAKGAGKIDVREKKETTIHQFTAVFPYRTLKEPKPRPTFVTLTGLPLLIVSADAEQRKELSEMARSWRMNPREADNAAVALQLLSRMADEGYPVALVITSNTLPVQDGFMLAFRIKHMPKLKQTAVMMLAKSGKAGDAIACRENGISAYLRHPIAANQLNEAISAVMGTQDDDSEATSTLITRHSLREAKAGSVLIVDPNREQAIVPVSALKKKDYRVVYADTADEAYVELSQDVFDLLIIDPMAKGFAELGIEGISDALQARFATMPSSIPVLLAVEDDISAVEFGFSGMLSKPYDKEVLLAKVAALIPAKAAG